MTLFGQITIIIEFHKQDYFKVVKKNLIDFVTATFIDQRTIN